MLKKKTSFAKLADTFTESGLCRQDITALGEEALVSLYGGSEGEELNCLRYIDVSVRRLQEVQSTLSHRFCPQQQLLLSSTVYVFIIKYKNGRDVQIWILRNMGGKYRTICCFQL